MLIALITKYLGGRALKAVAGGLVTSNVAAAFTEGFTTGLVPLAHDLGLQIAMWIAVFLGGYIPVYAARNKPDPK